MNIYESIAAIQVDVDFIGKEKQTQSGAKFKYRGVDQVLNTLHPLFGKHKVFAVPEVLEILNREERKTKEGNTVLYQVLKIKYTFYAEDSTSVSAVVVGEAMDSGDKVSNKCMSVAYKYACFQILSIPTEDTTQDPDEHGDELQPKGDGNPSAKVTKRRGLALSELKDLGVEDIKGMAKYLAEQFGKPITEFDEDERAESIAWIKENQAKKKAKAEERARKAREEFENSDERLPWETQ